MSERRQRVERLQKYSIFKSFNFIQLAYLSSFYQQKTYGYKAYLYTQGQVPSEIYLIQEGEFELTLFLENNEENQIRNKLKQKLARNKSLSKQKNDPIDFQESSLLKKLKPTKINEFKVGTVVGGMGQLIGVQQIVLNKEKRKYNAKCVSTNNSVIVIKKQHLLKVLSQNPQLMSKLKLQLTERQKITHEAHQKMYFLRRNRDSLVKLLLKQNSRERNITVPTQKLQNQSPLKLPLLERRNQTEMRKKQMSMNEKFHIKASNDSFLTIDDFDDPRGITLMLSQSEANAQTFMLTELEHFDTEVLKKNKQKLNKLSQLSIDKIQEVPQEKIMGLKTSKSQISSQISPKKLLPKRKYNGAIDSSLLVKEKQRIAMMRKSHKQTNERVQLEEKYLKAWKQNLLQKEREKHSSTVHSKHFMERMLLTALKKAGYQQETIQGKKKTQMTQNVKTNSEVQHLQTENSFQDHISLINETRNLKLEKLGLKIKKKRKVFFGHASQILESNPFDECYFKKFN